MGSIIGGTLLIYVLAYLFEWALWSRVLANAWQGAWASGLSAYIFAVTLYGFGSANGGPWNPAGFITYLPGMIIFIGICLWRISRQARTIDDAE